jgi:para-nitrobenzyl esterase
MGTAWMRRAMLCVGLVAGSVAGCSDNGSPGGGAPGGPDGSTPGADAGGGSQDGSADDAPLEPCELDTPLGRVKGKLASGRLMDRTCQFLGIPYGKPPVSALRFAPPEPAGPWQGVRDATTFGPSCMQRASLVPGGASMSEDCLSLNIYTLNLPSAVPSSALPTMVFIHGGGYTLGGSSAYDGTLLSEHSGNVIVTINYLLGAFGFFAHPELDGERPQAPSGSDGIRDQQLALRWVKDNISAFHGSPINVTVFGESAGSGSASLHLVSPLSRDLAARFILQSGASVGTGFGTSSREAGYTLATAMGSALCAGATDVVACLRAKPAQELVDWTGGATGLFGAPWMPVIEGREGGVLPDSPQNLITNNNYNRAAPIIAGTNKNEWGLFQLPVLGGMPLTTMAQFKAAVAEQFGARAAEVEAQYPVATDGEANDVYVRLMTDLLFRCPTRLLARLTTRHGTDFYLYSFEEGTAYHADELSYVFGTAGFFGMPPTQPLGDYMQAYWGGFADSGIPITDGLLSWKKYDSVSEFHLVLKNPLSSGSALAKSDCDFWDRFNP